ncbi:MAG: AMP-binding protein [Flavobacteriales bacterium]
MDDPIEYFRRSLAINPDTCLIFSGGKQVITYSDFASQVDQFTMALLPWKNAGLPIAIWMKKSVTSLVFIQAILESGNTYVPIDPEMPLDRLKSIFDVLNPVLVVCDNDKWDQLKTVCDFEVELENDQLYIGRSILNKSSGSHPEIATILFTSGSTGVPKGVCIPRIAITSFIEWAQSVLNLSKPMVFSSFAPLHFDLSILDIFLAFRSGSSLVLFTNDDLKQPENIVLSLKANKVDFWYSTPTALMFLMNYGKIQELYPDGPKFVLFAGEVFPPQSLKKLMAIWPGSRYYNFYGPTETNVCTYFEIPDISRIEGLTEIPLGIVCNHFEARVKDDFGGDCSENEIGELHVSGPALSSGYLNDSLQTNLKFYSGDDGKRWYRTGDFVAINNGIMYFHGRRDRMIKRRGFRIELDDVEAAIMKLNLVGRAACVAVKNNKEEVEIISFVEIGMNDINILGLKISLSKILPLSYMPDKIIKVNVLPTTSTGKVDYVSLTKEYAR